MSAVAFFDAARALKRELTGDVLSQEDVDALNAVIASWTPSDSTNPTALSDASAFFASVRKGLATTLLHPWYGRGFVQLTWEANYKHADEALGLNGALIANPDTAMQPDIAAKILTKGMEEGWFTRRGLKDYLPLSGRAGFDAYKEARRIINGTDKFEIIAKEAQVFEAALLEGGWQ
jgi:hypothetical protein